MIRRLVFVAFFVEVGLLLIVLPWSAFWEQNYFARAWPFLQPVFVNNFIRGGISGLGLVNLVAGVFELMPMFVIQLPGESVREPVGRESLTGNPDA